MASAYPPTGSQPPSVELTVRQGPQPGQRFSLNKPAITIGREVGNDVAINDPQISRRHASLTWDGRQFIIQDLGSANGTFVNGVRLTGPQVLQQGDVIGLGPTVHLGFQAMLPAPVPPHPAAPPPAYAPPPPAYAPRPPARGRGRFLIPLTALLGLCFVLAVAAALGYFFLWPRPDVRPLVLIRSPRHGEQVEVGQGVTVHSVARDESKVVRVELWVDGQLQESQTSNLPGGTSPFPLLARWQPSSPGTHTLIARAFNARGGRGQASVNVEAIKEADRDGDGVADEADACPDEPGTEAADGCPDRDGDRTPDAEDACPDEPGLPENDGCPVPSEGDRDGDGIRDEADACPDEAGPPSADGCPDADGDGVRDSDDACPAEPGLPERDGCPGTGDLDGDGVPDAEDACPEESGLPEHGGCPDRDGDGIQDGDDECPDEPGLPEHAGCPDRDGDGVRDREDACPDVPGPAPSGCPDSGVGDRDGDGIPDDIDDCPDDFGPGPSGCPDPDPGGGDTDDSSGGIPGGDLIPGGGPGGGEDDVIIMNPVVFEALEFEVDHEYQEVHCYAGLAGEDMERYDFEPLGETQWDIAEHLGGANSRLVTVREDEPSLAVQVECWASNIYPVEVEESPGGIPEGSAWGTVWDLGTITEHHPRSDWDGHVLTPPPDPGSDGHSFEVQYRICADSCETAAFAAPLLLLTEIGPLGGGEPWMRVLTWRWGGDESMINGFKLYVDGSFYTSFRRDLRSYELRGSLLPACGERLEYQMTAYSGATLVPERESHRSNTLVLEGPPCPRTVRVQFLSLQTGHLGDDEWWADGESVGPIFGNFWATGSSEERLEFSAVDYPEWWGQRIRGYRLAHNREYEIQGIFDEVWNWIVGSMSSPYRVPSVDYVDVELGPDDDLTFGGVIWDADTGNPSDILFEGDDTIPADEVPVPGGGGGYTIRDRNIELRVWIMGLWW